MTLTNNLFRLRRHVNRRRRWQLVGLLILTLVGALAEMATLGTVLPFLGLFADLSMVGKYPILEKVFDWFGTSEDHLLLSAALLFAVTAVGAGLVRLLLMWVSLRISYGLGADIGAEVYRRTLFQPYSWHVSKNSSEVLAGIDKVNAVVNGIISPLAQGAVAFMLSVGILAMLLAIDLKTALVSGIGFSVLYGITILTFRRKLVRNSKAISNNLTQRVRAVQEGLGGIRDILLDGTQHIHHGRFVGLDHSMRSAQAANGFVAGAPRYIIETCGMILIVALAYRLAREQGGLTDSIPVLGALAIGAQKLLPQIQQVYYSWTGISSNRHQLMDVLDLLDLPIPREVPIEPEGSHNDDARIKQIPLIAMRNVSFRYRSESAYVLQDISFDIFQGARIGIIGTTGSGKSTLIDLIMGLLTPTSGNIEIEGKPLNALNRHAWQKRIAHVPQSIYLSDSSIAENIAFGALPVQIDLDRVRASASLAQLDSFVGALPKGWHTKIGERGVRLSGGQRQRIGLARALYKNAKVLVLDESTNALDVTTEKTVMRAIHELGNGITVIIVAHRVSTLLECDTIIEITHSKISRIGNYQSLFESKA